MAAGEVVVNVDLGYFEEDVIAEILARLPVKSLKRFRCVCKPWRALISASYLVKKHLSYQEKGITESPRRLILNLDRALAFDCEAFKTTEALRNVVHHLGSCNGLVCVEGIFDDGMLINDLDLAMDYKSLILWNPCTRDFTALPNPPGQFNGGRYFHGLGYDSVNDDYKVLQGFVSYSDGGTKVIMIHIFSLKTGSWKTTVKDIDYVRLETDRGLFVNGAIHWLSNLPDGSGSSILSFDLGAEDFQKTVSLPYDDRFSDPFIHSNCLCVCTRPTGTNCINLWMMKE